MNSKRSPANKPKLDRHDNANNANVKKKRPNEGDQLLKREKSYSLNLIDLENQVYHSWKTLGC